MIPKRIQRKRTKGWKMSEGAVYVGRPTKWGNPFTAGKDFLSRAGAVTAYRRMIGNNMWTSPTREDIRRELAGKDLVCWCPLPEDEGEPDMCHAAVLLEIANRS